MKRWIDIIDKLGAIIYIIYIIIVIIAEANNSHSNPTVMFSRMRAYILIFPCILGLIVKLISKFKKRKKKDVKKLRKMNKRKKIKKEKVKQCENVIVFKNNNTKFT